MRTLLSILLSLAIVSAFAQKRTKSAPSKTVLATLISSATMTPEKPAPQTPIELKEGDTVRLMYYNMNTNLWRAKFKAKIGIIKDTALNHTDAVIFFKNDFIAKQYLVELKKKYGPSYGVDIYNATPSVGMTKKMFLVFMEKPDEINTTEGAWGTHEQWVYNNRPSGKTEYYYFENGRLTSWQY
ncbi:hypothetical protein ABZR88_20885 [Mucilaginibacter yixingensis]|nr:hypothetical protein [Mucilaginibacter yixingensis]